MSSRGRGRGRVRVRRRGVKRFREEYTEPEPIVEEKPSLNKKIVFPESDPEDSAPAPPTKKHCAEPDERKKRKTPDEVRIIRQLLLKKPSQFWKNVMIRGPFSDILFVAKVHHNRPLFNFIRLIFYKIYQNCINFLQNDLQRIMSGAELPDPKYLMGEMCEKVLWVEIDHQVYYFYVPHMTDYITRLFNKAFITVECNRASEIKNCFATLCHVKGIEVSPFMLNKIRNGFLRHFFYMASDLLAFVYETSNTENIAEITGFRHFILTPGDVFETFVTEIGYRGLVNRITTLHREIMTRKLPSPFLPLIACEESDKLLENVLEYGLLQRLPEGVKAFLTAWMTGVRKRVRKRLMTGKMQEIVQECFPRKQVPFVITLENKLLHKFLKKVVGKMLNSKSFTIFDGDWEETALEIIQTDRKILSEPFIRFFEVSELINYQAKAALTALFSRSVADRAMMYHTQAQLFRLVVYFVCFTIRHVFHYDGHGSITYDGHVDEEFDGFDEFDAYEQDPLIQLPKDVDVPKILERDDSMDIHPVQLRIFPTPTSFDSSVPPPKAFKVKTEKKSFMTSSAPDALKSVKTEKRSLLNSTPEPSVLKRSFLLKPKTESLSLGGSEVTEEELNSARALRPASECASDVLRDEDIPQKWRDAYALTLEWNRDIRQQLDRIVKRYERMIGGKG